MPMTYTINTVLRDLEMFKIAHDPKSDEMVLRELLAAFFDKDGEYVGAWEVRTGRPWTEMSALEAESLVEQHPILICNPGVLSRMLR